MPLSVSFYFPGFVSVAAGFTSSFAGVGVVLAVGVVAVAAADAGAVAAGSVTAGGGSNFLNGSAHSWSAKPSPTMPTLLLGRPGVLWNEVFSFRALFRQN